jgi:serpin B
MLDFAAPDAAATINRWVTTATNQRIRELVTPADLQQALLVLTNAVHFKGLWAAPFDEANTEERDFTLLDGRRRRHPMMVQSGRYAYYEDEHLQAVSLPYGRGRVDMVVLLPRPALPITAFLAALTTERWQAWTSQLHPMEGKIVLPRFKVTYGTDLLPALTALGGASFAGPDFLGMGAGPLVIGQVIHKTFLEVDEEGTEAAAATAVVMRKSLAQPFCMVVDRPFLCAIRDRETGALLFIGLVLDPTAE